MSAPRPAPLVAISPASDDEARACRMLMPETFFPYFAPECWVARDSQTGRIVGAAAVAWQPVARHAGFPIQIHVVPSARRRGVGTALFDTVSRICRESTRQLEAWSNHPEGSVAAAFLQSVGFHARRRLLGFEADGPRFYAMVRKIYDRVTRAVKIPSEFRVVALEDAPKDRVAELVIRNFEDVPISAAIALARGLAGYDSARSVVLLSGGEVKGALLYNWNDGLPVIDVRVVAPDLRNGPANVLLLEAATRNGLDAGARRFRFSCEESVKDTIKLARRSGAKPTGAQIAFTRPL